MQTPLSASTVAAIQTLFSQYPTRAAVLLPALHLVQKERGYIDTDAQTQVAALLDVPPTRVAEVVTFYTMFNTHKKGRHILKICRNLPCKLRGAEQLLACAEAHLGIRVGETTTDGKVTLEHEECLASCGTAPMLWHNGRFVENVDEPRLLQLLQELT